MLNGDRTARLALRTTTPSGGADPVRYARRAPLPWDAFSPGVLLLRAMAGGDAMKVYVDDDDGRWMVGCADLPEDCGPVYEVPAVTAALASIEGFAVGTATHLTDGGAPVAERAVLAAPGQVVELLPGWVPVAS